MEHILQIPSDVPSTRREPIASDYKQQKLHQSRGLDSLKTRFIGRKRSDKVVMRSLRQPKPSVKGYKFGKVIGQGGYGKVYECTSVPIKNKADSFKPHKRVEKVAIKVISKEKVRRKDIKQRVVKEIEIHQQAEHENIVSPS